MFMNFRPAMTNKIRCIRHHSFSLLSARSVSQFCVILFLGIVFWGGQSVAFATQSEQPLSLQPLYTIPLSADLTGSSSYVSLPPVISRLTHGQLEVFDEIGPNDDAPEAGLGKALEETAADRRFHFATVGNIFASYTEVSQSCATVCLFVLHHSWRSFIS